MRIGHVQLESVCGKFETNLMNLQEALKRVDRERIDIVSFPECFLTGYPGQEHIARRDAFAIGSPQVQQLLHTTRSAEAMFIVGFNEARGEDLYNTAVVVHRGVLIGSYSKCTAYMPFHKQGRSFPVFQHKGLTFGVIICSDGGYIEPARILAAKGAKVVFAPHFNCIGKEQLISHFMQVRADHTARAIENHIYFVRGNNVSVDDGAGSGFGDGVAYGDSYVLDPFGEIVVRSRRGAEDLIFCDLDMAIQGQQWEASRSAFSFREFGAILQQAVEPDPAHVDGEAASGIASEGHRRCRTKSA